MSTPSDLQSILQENLSYLKRKELLSQIEEQLSKQLGQKVAVAAYIANTMNPGVAAFTQMSLMHVAHVDDLIRTTSGDDVDAVALILESFGGEATFPSEVIQRAKKYCKNFYVIVVNVAKSAGTLLSMVSDGIITLETASFGPVDPQLVITTPQGPQAVSARQIKELIEVTLPNITKNLGPAEKAAILASQNYALYQQALDSLKLVKEVIDTQLGSRLSAKQIAKVKENLVDVPLSHSLKVTSKDLEELGFKITTLKAESDLGQTLIQYHRRALKNLIAETPNGQGLLLFESKKVSFGIVGQVIPQFLAARPAQPPPPKPVPQPGPEQPPRGEQPPTSSPG